MFYPITNCITILCCDESSGDVWYLDKIVLWWFKPISLKITPVFNAIITFEEMVFIKPSWWCDNFLFRCRIRWWVSCRLIDSCCGNTAKFGDCNTPRGCMRWCKCLRSAGEASRCQQRLCELQYHLRCSFIGLEYLVSGLAECRMRRNKKCDATTHDISPCWKKRKYDSSYLTFMLLHHYYRGNNDIKLLDNVVRHVMSFHLMPRLCSWH